jgi:hypothetical protein
MINNASFPNMGPTVPVLLQILSGAQTAQSLVPAGSVYTLPSNTVCDLAISRCYPGTHDVCRLSSCRYRLLRSLALEARYVLTCCNDHFHELTLNHSTPSICTV